MTRRSTRIALAAASLAACHAAPAPVAPTGRAVAAGSDAATGRALLALARVAHADEKRRAMAPYVEHGSIAVTVNGRTRSATYDRYVAPGVGERLELGWPGHTTASVDGVNGICSFVDGKHERTLPSPGHLFRTLIEEAEAAGDLLVGERGALRDGRRVDELRYRWDGVPYAIQLDPTTHLIARIVRDEPRGRDVDELDDYRTVGGVPFAHRALHRHADRGESLITLDEILVDQPLAPGLFTCPPLDATR